MRKSILLLATWSILVFGCSKKNSNEPAQETQQSSQTTKAFHHSGAKGDDDDPILMEITPDTNGNPIPNSVVTCINASDTIQGTTDDNGQCLLVLTQTGQWNLNIKRPGYICVNEQITISDSFTVHTDTLVQGMCTQN